LLLKPVSKTYYIRTAISDGDDMDESTTFSVRESIPYREIMLSMPSFISSEYATGHRVKMARILPRLIAPAQ
jgi:hypothetical protein